MIALAYLLDQWLADPPHWPHPVKLMGRLIQRLEQHLYSSSGSKQQQLLGGLLLVILVLVSSYSTVWLGLQVMLWLHPALGYVFALYLTYASLSAKGLKLAAVEVLKPLEAGDIAEARKKLSLIVGRDTEALWEEGIARAVVETVAENFSDGVIAPLFYFVIGGAPLAILYKAINTMDSMVGYQNQRYQYFGRVAAKLDDVANWIPARLSAVLLIVAGVVSGFDWMSGVQTALSDGRNHKSPNAGWPEAAVAGVLGIQLGGANTYFGTLVVKPTIGQPGRKVDGEAVRQSLKLLDLASGMAMIAALVLTMMQGGS